jgi:hypothetical protein
VDGPTRARGEGKTRRRAQKDGPGQKTRRYPRSKFSRRRCQPFQIHTINAPLPPHEGTHYPNDLIFKLPSRDENLTDFSGSRLSICTAGRVFNQAECMDTLSLSRAACETSKAHSPDAPKGGAVGRTRRFSEMQWPCTIAWDKYRGRKLFSVLNGESVGFALG